MLKIKDDVDLKELEKFGFKLNKHGMWSYLTTKKTYWIDAGKCTKKKERHIDVIQVRPIEREILVVHHIKIEPPAGDGLEEIGDWTDRIDVIYDLIKADLVEKI